MGEELSEEFLRDLERRAAEDPEMRELGARLDATEYLYVTGQLEAFLADREDDENQRRPRGDPGE